MPLNDIRSALRLHLLANSNVSPIIDGTRMYPVVLPQGVTEPSIVYHLVSGIGDHTMQGPSGLNRPRLQLDAYAQSYDDAVELADLVKEALDGYSGLMSIVPVQGAFFDTEREDYQSDVKLYRVSRDYLIWVEER